MKNINWTTILSERGIDSLPIVLAGPILRRVEKNSVTVWIALKENIEVQLLIKDWKGEKTIGMSGKETPVALGENLSMVCIIAKDLTLASHTQYTYDIILSKDGKSILKDIYNNGLGISYHDHKLPSFILPTQEFNNINIFHGSCRKPHGPGKDALSILYKQIEDNINDTIQRPQILVLTGDQIYADDVADLLLYLINDAIIDIFGIHYCEWLPNIGPNIPDKNKKALMPGNRADLLKEWGFTSQASKSHLIGFCEYILMYLFVWSDELWPDFIEIQGDAKEFGPKEVGAQFKEITGKEYFRTRSSDQNHAGNPEEFDTDAFVEYKKEIQNLSIFFTDIKFIRRALANIPTYMIFDDHEVTDDWNISAEWCQGPANNLIRGIYQNNNNVGRRVVANALAAYAICQAWGNEYKTFSDGNGIELLSIINNGGMASENNWVSIQNLLLPDEKNIIDNNTKRLSQPIKSIKWHYRMEFESFDLIVLDSRTHRQFRGERGKFPCLIYDESMNQQLEKFKKDNVIIVLPAPFIGVPIVESLQWVMGIKSDEQFLKMDCESPGLDKYFFEKFLSKISYCLNDSKEEKRVFMFSGDVHYGFSCFLNYIGIRTLDDPESNNEKRFTLYQLTSSALKNFADDFLGKILGLSDNEIMKTMAHLAWQKVYGYLDSKLVDNSLSIDKDSNVVVVPINNISTLSDKLPDIVKNVKEYFNNNRHAVVSIDLLSRIGLNDDLLISGLERKKDWWYLIFWVRDVRMDKERGGANDEQKLLVRPNNIGSLRIGKVDGKHYPCFDLWWHLPQSGIVSTQFFKSFNVDAK